MKARKYKHKVMERMDKQAFDYDSNRMYRMRHIKPCKEYSPWCPHCNVVLFKQETGRFPYSITEFNYFEDMKQEEDMK
jgi:hypothetical protein